MVLYETCTHDMYWSAVEHYREILWILATIAPPPKKKLGAEKLPIFDDFATQ